MDREDEQEIISAVLGGNTEAFALLVARYQKPIFNLMMRMTGSMEDAADLTQDTFVKAFQSLNRFQEGRRFFPWLYALGLNHSRNFLLKRKTSRERMFPIDDVETGSGLDYPGQEEENLCSRLDLERVRSALDRLPPDYREALVLRYHEDLPMEDVATALEVSLSGAKMRVHRGLKKLRTLLDGEERE